ncbi:MAG: amidohydrolase [Xanthomonadales bacterium]|nr:amidohydrolase [Xanthomonadales bacterium]
MAVFASLLLILATAADPQTVVVSADRVYTMDPDRSVVEALAYGKDGKLLAVGRRETLLERYPDAARRDYAGQTIVPGLIDAHAHLLGLGLALLRADLVGAESRKEVLDRLRAFDRSLPEGAWLLGRGWDQNDWPDRSFPTREDLDRSFPNRPIWLIRIDGHAGWANSAALAAADRDLTGDWQPEGGRIMRDEDGRPTGIFIDRAMGLIQRAVPEPDSEILREALRRALEKAATVGLTGVHDMTVSYGQFALYREYYREHQPTLRVYAYSDGDARFLDELCRHGPVEEPFLTARGVKFYVDGALGSRGAALHEDYADDPGNRGLLIQPRGALAELIDRAMGCGLQVATHAIGDRGNSIVLDLYEELSGDHPENPGRHRIEHAQVVVVDELSRFAEEQVIASVQPTHATSDMYWAEDRVGPERIRGAYAWRSLIEEGARLALGSDFPVERPDPLLGLYAAVTRQDLEGWPAGGWYASEGLSREEALAGFTRDAAYAAFAEDEVGSLEPGKRADFVVLGGDLMTVPASEIPRLPIIATYVDGRAVYENKAVATGKGAK